METSQPSFTQPGFTPRTQLVVQWGSGGESHIDATDRDALYDIIKGTASDEMRFLFPVHGAYGSMSLGHDRFTLWLVPPGGKPCIAGELVEASTARPRQVPASGTVDISTLPPEAQLAVMTLLRRANG